MYKHQLFLSILLLSTSSSYGMVKELLKLKKRHSLPISSQLHDDITRSAPSECKQMLPAVVHECRDQADPLQAFEEYKALLQLHLRCRYIAHLCPKNLKDKDRIVLMTQASTYSQQKVIARQADALLLFYFPTISKQVDYCCRYHLESIEPQLKAAEEALKNSNA